MMHIGSRFCSRCGKDLTDAASMEAGVGPICRKMDNALLAQLIPADVDAARKAFHGSPAFDAGDVVLPTLANIEADLHVGMSDWRTTVKRIEWVLSHKMSYAAREALYATVAALGYTAVVAMWRGEAASGKATVRFEAGRMFLKGPRNKAGAKAIKAIKGWFFNGTTKEWSVPVASAEAFVKAVTTYWPSVNTDPSLGTAMVAATEWVASGAAAPEAPKAKPTASVFESTSPVSYFKDFPYAAKTPYNADFVAAVKSEIPYASRRWDSNDKVWRVTPAYKATLEALVTKFYA